MAIEHAGGPIIPFRFGRKDGEGTHCTENGRLPDANKVGGNTSEAGWHARP